MAKQKYYVVWEGASCGVFLSWDECQEAVHGHPGAKYKSFSSMEEAEDAYNMGYEAYVAEHASASSEDTSLSDVSQSEEKAEISPTNPVLPVEVERFGRQAIAVDAACSGNPGPMEYQGVYLDTGQQIFHYGPLYGTNNIGEFLAIVHGLALLKQRNLNNMPIYSDSVNAQLWVRRKKCKTTLERNEKTEALFQMIERAEQWLRNNTYSNPILKWQTDKWGEIPADFGRK